MRTTLFILGFLLISGLCFSQESTDSEGVKKACVNYLEGFYEGNILKLKAAIKPALFKFGYWKNKETDIYAAQGNMTYQQALDYAKGVAEKKNFAKKEAPKKVDVLDISNHIAAAKITAWWGVDYVLLSKTDGIWMIEQVIWEGPLEKTHLN